MKVNKKIFNEFFFILWVCFIQVMILNQVDFLGYINPYFYIIYVLRFRANRNKYAFLLASFFLGWIVDHFMDTVSIHAFSMVLVAYIKILIIKLINKKKYIKDDFSIESLSFFKKILYIFIFVFFHQFVLLSLETIRIFEFKFIFLKGFYSSIFTSFLCLIYFYLK